jgi:hypothetical protein
MAYQGQFRLQHKFNRTCLTAVKFKPLIFSVSGFALSNIENMYNLVMLNDLGLLPA